MKRLSFLPVLAALTLATIQAQKVAVYIMAKDNAKKPKQVMEQVISKNLPDHVKALSSDQAAKILGKNLLKKYRTVTLDDDWKKKLSEQEIHTVILGSISLQDKKRYTFFLRIIPVSQQKKPEQLKMEPKYLFGLKDKGKYEKYFTAGKIPQGLKNVMKKKKRSFSDDAKVQTLVKKRKWLITDGKKQYFAVTSGAVTKIYLKLSYSPGFIKKKATSFVKNSKILAEIPKKEVLADSNKETSETETENTETGNENLADANKETSETETETETENTETGNENLADSNKETSETENIETENTETGNENLADADKETSETETETETENTETIAKGWFQETLPKMLKAKKAPGQYWYQQDNSVMVYVSPGAFYDQKEKDEEVKLPAYYIDKYEVSNEQYCRFLNSLEKIKQEGKWYIHGLEFSEFDVIKQEQGIALDRLIDIINAYSCITFEENRFVPIKGAETYPVINVSRYGALAYAKWAGKSLPTEQQWVKALRGGIKVPDFKNNMTDIDNDQVKRFHPWGNDKPDHLFFRSNYKVKNDRYEWLAPVTEFEGIGDSPYGCSQMAGNVWEWCVDTFSEKTDSPLGVCRGGSWGSDSDQLGLSRCEILPSQKNNDLGFRCILLVE